MATVKDVRRAAVFQHIPQLVKAMCYCKLNMRAYYLGPMYAVLFRRLAQVLKEEMQEGSPLITVHAYVTLAESFRFADELRKWTSRAVSMLILLSH
ncbi:hypothetical protein CRG98_042685 [Punica granatum]|uniref:Uncharacterized protein n=1 Tax=Punica granatum TaxID=22663 RepID=A0A2I0HZ12_PUNGR|nr:hypothetical protein CRG98_042685 [Punica granatum]